MFFETALENSSIRKHHQNGTVACDHKLQQQCKFGFVHYADPTRAATSFAMSKGKLEWLRNQLDIFKTQQSEQGLSASGMKFEFVHYVPVR